MSEAHPERMVLGAAGAPAQGGSEHLPMQLPMLWLVRTRSSPFAASAVVQRELTVATSVPVARDFVRSMEQMVAESTGRQTFNTVLMTLFGSAALLLAGVGIYGVTTFMVQQRTEEIGIRLALGAAPTAVRRLIVTQSTLAALAGIAIGIVAAFGLARFVATMLFAVTTHDMLTFIMVPAVLVSIAFAAAWAPARHAANVDPMIALRAE